MGYAHDNADETSARKWPKDNRHPGWEFYTNTHGGDVYRRIKRDYPDLVLIEDVALDVDRKVIKDCIAIFTTSKEKLYNLRVKYSHYQTEV